MVNIQDLRSLLPESNIGLIINRNFDLGIPLHNQKIVHRKLNDEGYCIVNTNVLNNLIKRFDELNKIVNSYEKQYNRIKTDNSVKSKSLAEEIGLVYDDN